MATSAFGGGCGGASQTCQYVTPECGQGGYINNSCFGWSGCHRRYEVFEMQPCK